MLVDEDVDVLFDINDVRAMTTRYGGMSLLFFLFPDYAVTRSILHPTQHSARQYSATESPVKQFLTVPFLEPEREFSAQPNSLKWMSIALFPASKIVARAWRVRNPQNLPESECIWWSDNSKRYFANTNKENK